MTELSEKDIQVHRTPRSYSADGSSVETIQVSIDIAKYVNETLPHTRDSIDSSKTEGMTLTTGMDYMFDGQNVRITKIFGSAVTDGFYYATDKIQYYRHPGTGAGGKWNPSLESWSYNVDSGYGLYITTASPKAIMDCIVRITGMTSYREVSVTCSL